MTNSSAKLSNFSELESVRFFQIVEQRLAMINKLEKFVDDNALEKVIQEHLFEHLWIFDPTYNPTSANARLEQTVGKEFEKIDAKLSKEEIKGRIDIRYKAANDRHIIIELKRPGKTVSMEEIIEQLGKYEDALRKCLDTTGAGDPDSIWKYCILGDWPKGWDQAHKRRNQERALRELNITVTPYNLLLAKARDVYKEFLDNQRENTPLVKLFEELNVDFPQTEDEE